MKHTEFREQLLQSLLETAKDSLARRNETDNALHYVIHNTQMELLQRQINWAGGQKIDPCCSEPGKMAEPAPETS